MSFFQPRRPLRPTRKERKRVQGSSLIETKVGVIVNIVRAFNLPMRKETTDFGGISKANTFTLLIDYKTNN